MQHNGGDSPDRGAPSRPSQDGTGLLSSARDSFEAPIDDLVPPKRARSSTLTGFDYSSHLLSLTASSEPSVESGARATTHLTAFNGAALMLGVQIGAGIFSSPGVVLAHVAAPGPALLVWIGSGLLAWTGAASFAELGAASEFVYRHSSCIRSLNVHIRAQFLSMEVHRRIYNMLLILWSHFCSLGLLLLPSRSVTEFESKIEQH